METAELRPGYVIPRVIRGAWQLSEGHSAVDKASAVDDFVAAADAGFVAIDCADHYVGVEQLVGAFRKRYADLRGADALKRVKVHTKYVPDLETLATVTKADARAIIVRSLQRMGQERLDLVRYHWWDYAVERYVEVASWLADFAREGLIELVGGTNFSVATTAAMIRGGVPIAAMQVQYSLFDQRPAAEMADLARERGIQFLCYGTLAGGFLSNRWLGRADPGTEVENRSLTKYRLIIEEFGGWDAFQALLATLDRVATKHGVGIAEIAVRWTLDRPMVAAAIVGARNSVHLAETARVFGVTLDDADRAAIQRHLDARGGPFGDVYALERDRNGRHGRIMRYNQNKIPA
jgi:aryl-alcohol dehydrogenase-like predicted oxidoreductase